MCINSRLPDTVCGFFANTFYARRFSTPRTCDKSVRLFHNLDNNSIFYRNIETFEMLPRSSILPTSMPFPCFSLPTSRHATRSSNTRIISQEFLVRLSGGWPNVIGYAVTGSNKELGHERSELDWWCSKASRISHREHYSNFTGYFLLCSQISCSSRQADPHTYPRMARARNIYPR